MMALIAMAIYDTEQNQRTELTKQTLLGLARTVDFSRHRLVLIDNASVNATKDLLFICEQMEGLRDKQSLDFPPAIVITNTDNRGTARAINQGWELRKPGEHCIKMDNDVVVKQEGWVDILEECVEREPRCGIVCLKRSDLTQWAGPNDPVGQHTKLVALPHKNGQRWLAIEKCTDSFGTVQLYSSSLLDKIGYLYQPTVYGADDLLADVRCQIAGFWSTFYPFIELDYLDKSDRYAPYQAWKEWHAREHWNEYTKIADDYKSGVRSIYQGPND